MKKGPHVCLTIYELRHEKTCLRGCQPGLTQTRLYTHVRWLDAQNFGLKMKRDCTIYVVKTEALICAFVFAYAKSRFSHLAAHIHVLTASGNLV